MELENAAATDGSDASEDAVTGYITDGKVVSPSEVTVSGIVQDPTTAFIARAGRVGDADNL